MQKRNNSNKLLKVEIFPAFTYFSKISKEEEEEEEEEEENFSIEFLTTVTSCKQRSAWSTASLLGLLQQTRPKLLDEKLRPRKYIIPNLTLNLQC